VYNLSHAATSVRLNLVVVCISRRCIFVRIFVTLEKDGLLLAFKRDERFLSAVSLFACRFISQCLPQHCEYVRLQYSSSSSKSQAFLPQFLLLLSTDHFRRVRSASSIMRGWRFRVAEADSVACIYIEANKPGNRREREETLSSE
jgi:hypothetical protein